MTNLKRAENLLERLQRDLILESRGDERMRLEVRIADCQQQIKDLQQGPTRLKETSQPIPPRPVNIADRLEETKAVREILVTEGVQRIVAISGESSVGKSTLQAKLHELSYQLGYKRVFVDLRTVCREQDIAKRILSSLGSYPTDEQYDSELAEVLGSSQDRIALHVDHFGIETTTKELRSWFSSTVFPSVLTSTQLRIIVSGCKDGLKVFSQDPQLTALLTELELKPITDAQDWEGFATTHYPLIGSEQIAALVSQYRGNPMKIMSGFEVLRVVGGSFSREKEISRRLRTARIAADCAKAIEPFLVLPHKLDETVMSRLLPEVFPDFSPNCPDLWKRLLSGKVTLRYQHTPFGDDVTSARRFHDEVRSEGLSGLSPEVVRQVSRKLLDLYEGFDITTRLESPKKFSGEWMTILTFCDFVFLNSLAEPDRVLPEAESLVKFWLRFDDRHEILQLCRWLTEPLMKRISPTIWDFGAVMLLFFDEPPPGLSDDDIALTWLRTRLDNWRKMPATFGLACSLIISKLGERASVLDECLPLAREGLAALPSYGNGLLLTCAIRARLVSAVGTYLYVNGKPPTLYCALSAETLGLINKMSSESVLSASCLLLGLRIVRQWLRVAVQAKGASLEGIAGLIKLLDDLKDNSILKNPDWLSIVCPNPELNTHLANCWGDILHCYASLLASSLQDPSSSLRAAYQWSCTHCNKPTRQSRPEAIKEWCEARLHYATYFQSSDRETAYDAAESVRSLIDGWTLPSGSPLKVLKIRATMLCAKTYRCTAIGSERKAWVEQLSLARKAEALSKETHSIVSESWFEDLHPFVDELIAKLTN